MGDDDYRECEPALLPFLCISAGQPDPVGFGPEQGLDGLLRTNEEHAAPIVTYSDGRRCRAGRRLQVARSDGLAGASITSLASQRLLAESLGGSVPSVIGDDVPRSLLDFARAHLVGPGHRAADVRVFVENRG